MSDDLEDGESVEVQGSGSARYTLRNMGGVYSCTCPAWRNQSLGLELRSCKHLRAYRGEAAELARVGTAPASRPSRPPPSVAGEAPGAEPPPLLLAHRWENDVELTGWWMSEKLDGVRAYWDGKRFLSRLGNEYAAPAWFTAALPPTPLDGELWGGRKQFQQTISVVRRKDMSADWKQISYVVFDAPAHGGTFEERIAEVKSFVAKRKPPHAVAHEHERVRDVAHLRVELARVEALGGEGLMLRKPGSAYVVGRSTTLLKVKSFHDAEARVLDHLDGGGRHKGRLGALLVELPNGTRFSVGTGFSDAERAQPPPQGSVVTFRYQELSDAGVPRFPSYVGVRDDFAWPGQPAAKVTKVVTKPAKPPKPVAASPSPVKAGAGRRFELVEGTSSKFWEIEVTGAAQTVRFGRIGTPGTAKTKSFPSDGAAEADTDRLIREKTAKGYTEV